MTTLRYTFAAFAAATMLAAAPVAAAQQAYDLTQLNPQVQGAVIQARAAHARGEAAAARAREAATLGEAAAARARAGAAGTLVYDTPQFGDPPRTARYETEVVNGVRNGYGTQTYTGGPWIGDHFAGQFVDGRKQGLGVYIYGNNANNQGNAQDRNETEYVQSFSNGYGVGRWRDNSHYAGQFTQDHKQGFGVYTYADGRRFEGEYSNDQPAGFGVFWNSQGGIISQGIYSNGVLTTALTR